MRTKVSKKRYSKKITMLFILAVIILTVFGLGSYLIELKNSKLPPPPPDAPYKNANLPIEERIEDLLARMTLKEKVAQMALVEKNSVFNISDIGTYGLGSMLSGMGAKPEINTVAGWKVMIYRFNDEALSSRLGIPLLYGIDAIHGHSNLAEATIFPHSIGLGASGDATLVQKVAEATALELAATGIYWSYSPNLDLPQDIRWGRTYETFSDDPEIASELGVAYLNGLQNQATNSSSSSSSVFILGTLKHFLGAGGMVWGNSSNKNFKIDQGKTEVNEQLLREVYLPPFKAAVDNGALSVMAGLNSWGDTKLAAEKSLLTDLLKEELGFQGFVVSDWYGVYEIEGGDYKAAVTAINAGVDMVMLPFDYKTFIKNVTKAVERGEIEMSRIDDANRRILRAKFRLGLFEERKTVNSSVVGSTAHRDLAAEAVAKSLVLLKNDNQALPLTQNLKRILVAGSGADNVGRQAGAWSVEWQGIDGNWLPGSSSILQGIKEQAGEQTQIDYDLAGNFSLPEGELADVGIVVVSEAPYAEGWGDREYPILEEADLNAIKKVKAVSKKVVVLVISGRPILMTNELTDIDALVAAWLPGSEGKAVAPVLFGKKVFTGTLPLPWPKTAEQIPISPEGVTADGTTVLFPRGFGLTY
jgi:beta-glucosidase